DDVKKAINEATASLESADAAMALAIAEMKESIETAEGTIASLTGSLSDESAARKDLEATLNAADVDLQIQITALQAFQAAIEEADYQSQIDELKKYMDDETASNYDDLTDQITDLYTQIEDLRTSIAANTLDIATLQADMKDVQDALLEINPNLSSLSVLVEVGVTSVELVISYTADNVDLNDGDLTFSAAIVQANVFAPNVDNAITFNAGELVQVPQKFVVRVSPVNASLTADMIHFVNSQGEDMDKYVEVKSVDKYGELLTSSTRAAASGLYTIYAQLINGISKDDFTAATTVTNSDETTSKVLFAVQINNTLAAYADRYATSTYDLTMAWEEYTGENTLNYTVGDKDVADLNNRYVNDGNNPSLEYTDPSSAITYTELGWTGDAAVAAITEGDDKNAADDSNDNRADKDLYEAQVGVPFTISIYAEDEDGNKVDPEHIRAMFVALDFEENAIESAPSEWAAWTKFSYTGLNTVIDAQETGYPLSATITVNSSEANGDIIGFRVFAVNYDGTLVDPDGKAFYIVLGSQSTNWGEAETTITPVSDSEYTTTSTVDALDLSSVSLSNAATITWITDQLDGTAGDDTTTPIFNMVMTNSKGAIVAYTNGGKLYAADGTEADSSTDLSSVTNVYTTVLDDPTTTAGAIYTWVNYLDDQEYTGTLTFTNSKGRTIGTITVTMTKVLPTGLPYSAEVKYNQLVDGKYYAFMVPSTDGVKVDWSTNPTTYGTMAMTSVFNYDKEAVDNGLTSNYQITWATSDTDSNGDLIDVDVAGDETLSVDVSYVDNKTYHDVTVGWNYGKISSATPNEDYVAVGYTFEAMYVCLYYEKVYTWAWAEDAITSVVYADKTFTLDLSTIEGTSLKDGEYNANAAGGYNGTSLEITEAHLTTDGNGVEDEYFTITSDGSTLTFTPVSVDTDPTGDVESTLTLIGTDIYGHDVTITLPFTVTKR
ncbi:MAG: hypothetical protein LUB83_02695, partial [Prevotellaceae bacterium]|nr:hypothetical protein [Prevotellaceae bacterium]